MGRHPRPPHLATLKGNALFLSRLVGASRARLAQRSSGSSHRWIAALQHQGRQQSPNRTSGAKCGELSI